MGLRAENIKKQIRGKVILDDISLDLNEGTIYGFHGRNGSGKTMLFRALSGLMHVDSGKIVYGDKELGKEISILPNLGIIIENAGLYPYMTGVENLAYLAGFRKLIGKNEVCEVLERVGLDPSDRRTVNKYSLGMRQRLIIAQAIMEKPDVLMLDEPTNALDEAGVELVRNIILEEKKRGALILLASHNREDMQILADEVIHIESGRIKDN